jgi:hypothetical protein
VPERRERKDGNIFPPSSFGHSLKREILCVLKGDKKTIRIVKLKYDFGGVSKRSK